MPEETNVTEEVVTSTDESQEVVEPEQQEQESENQTPQESVVPEEEVIESVEEEQKVPYSRFQEVNEERKFLREQLARVSQPKETETKTDPYAGMDAETEKFWRAVDDRADARVEAKLKETKQTINAGRQEIARIQANQFYKDHSDVKQNSPEANEIAIKVNRGYDLEDAYKSVMFNSAVSKGKQQAVNKGKQKVTQKKQANMETGSVSPSVQKAPRETFDESFNKAYDSQLKGNL